MLQLSNLTPFAAEILALPDRDGVDTVFAVVKGTFALDSRLGLADEQLPVTLADEHHGEPGKSSVRVPSDVCLGKPATDVLLLGSAWAPGGRPAWEMDVSVAVGSATKTVRVFADRVWDTGPAGATMAYVTPFDRLPLVWERAFGGMDQTEKGPRAEPRNPVGIGFRDRDGQKPLAGMRLPNLEDPHALISSWRDAPTPACFAPVAAHWQPRVTYAGTYDAAWEQSRAPYLPTDFNPWFFQVAPRELVVAGYLRGGEPVEVRGATPAGVLRFALPAVALRVEFALDAGVHTRPAELETVLIEPDASRLVMVWRAALACDKKVLKVREVRTSMLRAA